MSKHTDQANVAEQGAASKLYLALEKLVPHVLHYASMPHAHPDAHRDAADARRVLADFAIKMNTDQYYASLPASDRPVFDQAVGGFMIPSNPHLGSFPRNYAHAAQALARSRGVHLTDDEHVVPRDDAHRQVM